MRTIIYAMRHGEKDGDMLTPHGKLQVAAAVEAHLPSYVGELHCSDMHRAKQTAQIVSEMMEVVGGELVINVNLGFGFQWLEEGTAGTPETGEAYANLKAIQNPPTPETWLQGWPRAWELRGRFIGEMMSVHRSLAKLPMSSGMRTAVICSHDPIVALAASEDVRNQAIGLADIVRYAILNGVIEESTLLRCPDVE